MKQIVLLHGGTSFNSYERYLEDLKTKSLDYDRLRPSKRWRDSVVEAFSNDDVLLPSFPNTSNAQYDEWALYFEKLVPHLRDNVHIVAHSLGGAFIAKYLSQHPLQTPLRQLLLVAPPYSDETSEDLGDFTLHTVTQLNKSCDEVHIFLSKDDPIVPFSELAKFQADLPNAICHVFEDRGHFLQDTFPELIEILKQK